MAIPIFEGAKTLGRVSVHKADPITLARALRDKGHHFGAVLALECEKHRQGFAVLQSCMHTACSILLRAGVEEIAEYVDQPEPPPARDDNGDELPDDTA